MRPTLQLSKALKSSKSLEQQFVRAKGAPTGAAFAMVQTLLTERPRHFREILADGVGNPRAAISGSQSQSAKGKKKQKGGDDQLGIQVPEGHPFDSGNYLKSRILPVLESMKLIKKEWQQPAEPSVLSHLKNKQCMWRLSPEGNSSANNAKYWEKLTSPDLTENDLARMGFAAKDRPEWVLAQLREKHGLRSKEQKVADKDARREKKGKLFGEERARDLTRTHLNTRRRKGREEKEQRYAEEMRLRREAKESAEAAVKAEMAEMAQ